MRSSLVVTLSALVVTVVTAACGSAHRPEPSTGDLAPGELERPPSFPAASDAGATVVPVPSPTGPPSVETSDDGRASLPEDFPAGTRSLRVKEIAHVFRAPADHARYVGKIVGGTRVGWLRVVAADQEERGSARRNRPPRCPIWVEIRPSGFLCKSLLVPSQEEPVGIPQPVIHEGRRAPDDYFKVMTDDTKAYKSEADVRTETVDKLLSTKVMLVGSGVVHIDDEPYLKTDHGLILASALGKFWPSDFAGVVLREHPTLAWPFAWIFFERGGRKPAVYAAPDLTAAKVRSGERREVVPFLEEQNGFVRVGNEEWIERKSLRVAALTTPPARLAADERWIDIDRDEQVLVAYEGKTPVFATLVSTGRAKNPTPLATYRVRAKAATTPMDGDPKVPNRYEVSAVPWAVRFANGFFIHGVYWHDGFGGARSHGCVNVSPKDAAYLFNWIGPRLPDGWSEIEVPANEGAVVRLRDHEHPDPPMFDYSKQEPWNSWAVDPAP